VVDSSRGSGSAVAECFQNRLGVFWRHQEWSCEYVAATPPTARGTVKLFMGSALAAQHSAYTLNEVLRVASYWRAVIVGNRSPHESVPTVDRRHGPRERRRVHRRGRRDDDRGW
jgi:hypothetical protein